MAINLIQALSQQGPRQMVQQQGPQNANLAKALTRSAYADDPIETPIEGLGRFAAAWQGNRISEKNKDAEMQQYQALADALSGGGDPMEALMASGNPDMIKMGAEHSLRDALSGTKSKTPKIDTFYDDTGGSYKGIYDHDSGEVERIGGIKPPSGMSISFDENGNPVVSQGTGALTKKGNNAVEEKQLNAVEMRQRLQGVKTSTKPEYLTYGGRLSKAYDSVMAGIDPNNLDPQEQQELRDYTIWRSRTVNNLNSYIKEMTGAAMSEPEAVRLSKAVPTENDDPISFAAKLDDVLVQLNEKLTLYEQQRRQGAAPDYSNMSDEDLDAKIRAMGGQ